MKKVSKLLVLVLVFVVFASVLTACGEGNTDGFSPTQAEQILKDAGFTIVTSTKDTNQNDKVLHSIVAYKGAITNITTVTVFVSKNDVEDPGVDMLGMIYYFENIQIAGGIPSVNKAALDAFKAAEDSE